MQIHPADGAILGILLLVASIASCSSGTATVKPLLMDGAILLAAYGAFVTVAARWPSAKWVVVARPFIAMYTIFALYYVTGQLGMATVPDFADPLLAKVDSWIFGGVNPTFVIQRWQTPGRVEFFAFFYALFIPYINLSLLLGSLGRPAVERDQFLTGWVFTYCISYLGYLLMPCHGPGWYFASSYTTPLHGGFFYATVMTGTARTGGLVGTFPSLHGGSSLYLCLFDLKTHRLRGLTYLPVVVMIYGATIFLRYHYVTDLIFGTAIAAACTRLGRLAVLAWRREDDVLPIFRMMAAIALWMFYQRIEVDGSRQLPAGPLLLVSNHRNGLVDPLLAMTVFDRRITLTGKNVLSKNRLLALLSWGLGMIPFHRPEDHGKGADPRQNVLSMRRCRDVLTKGGAVCIFPEGISHSDLQMRAFHVGAARVALDFVRKDGNPGSLRVLPIGLHYTSKGRFRSDVCVRVGQPIDVGQWAGDPKQLTAEIRTRIESLTISYRNRQEMLATHWTHDVVTAGSSGPAALGTPAPPLTHSLAQLDRLRAGYRSLQINFTDEIETLTARVRQYRRRLSRAGINPVDVFLSRSPLRAMLFVIRELELLLVGLPVAVFGILNHLLPCVIVRSIARRLSSDQDHWATNAIYPSFLIFLLFYAAQIVIAWCAFPALWAAVYTVALPYSGHYAVLYQDRVASAWRRARTFICFFRRPTFHQSLKAESRAILTAVTTLGRQLNVPTLASGAAHE